MDTRPRYVMNSAQHRGGWTIDNEDSTHELAFCRRREDAIAIVCSLNKNAENIAGGMYR